MPLARYHHLTLDSNDVEQSAHFWSAALGYQRTAGEGEAPVVLRGTAPGARIDIVPTPKPRKASRRLHLDLHARTIDDLLAAGGHVVDDSAAPWVVFHTPGHRELGVLLTDTPATRFYHVVIDSPEPEAIAAWYARILGTTLRPVPEDPDVAFIEPVPHAPFEAIVFARESEPKSEPNSGWMTFTTYDARGLELAGATRLGVRSDGKVRMADPQGNEFDVIELARPAG